ncbi:hypothetical protein BGZ52_007268, partial [Haplosporangium bisporale]
YGEVYLAKWGSQPCAAKRFFVNQSEFHRAAIQSEIAILQDLRHRHIVQFYRTHNHDDGHSYLIMDLAEKGSLTSVIESGTLSSDWPTKIRLADEIA